MTGDEVIWDEVTGDEMTGDEVTGDEMTGDEVTGDEMIGDEVTGDEMTGHHFAVCKDWVEITAEQNRTEVIGAGNNIFVV
ncbi:hypothetical protein BgiMline_011446 [Biomphalaria glabrata]